jgi:predicted enzyme related to lactoylglutathione lyase
MPRVIHFEISADEPERAVKFYQDVFGWEIHKWNGPEDYWLVITGSDEEPGINGGIMRRNAPGASTYNIIDVPSIDEFLARAVAAGGRVVLPKIAIPGVGYQAYCQDTEGNILGIHQDDLAAR